VVQQLLLQNLLLHIKSQTFTRKRMPVPLRPVAISLMEQILWKRVPIRKHSWRLMQNELRIKSHLLIKLGRNHELRLLRRLQHQLFPWTLLLLWMLPWKQVAMQVFSNVRSWRFSGWCCYFLYAFDLIYLIDFIGRVLGRQRHASMVGLVVQIVVIITRNLLRTTAKIVCVLGLPTTPTVYGLPAASVSCQQIQLEVLLFNQCA